jgi:hypothetical protein
MEKYSMILAAEEQFAREVTLGVIVSRPQTVWHYLIPGMFIFDFLRRGSAIRQYTRHFIYPRRLAIDAARSRLQEQDQSSERSLIEEDVTRWLNALNLHSEALLGVQMKAIDLLTDHYLNLLQAEGNSYPALIENAYQNRENFEAFINQITTAEDEIDEAILEKVGENQKLKEKLLAEKEQVRIRRQKLVEEIF